MQKRSSDRRPARGELSSISFDESLPVLAYDYVQRDEKILKLHHHAVFEVGLCHHGSGIFVIEDKCFDFKAGDLVLINSSEYHLAQSHRGTQSDWTFLHFDENKLIDGRNELNLSRLSGPDFCNRINSQQAPAIRHTFDIICKELKQQADHWQELVKSSIQQLIILLTRLPQTNSGITPKHSDIAVIAPAIELISSQYTEDISNTDLAQACHMSEVHFRRRFKKATGSTPHQYLNAFRIQLASGLLQQSDKSILHIALECGFPTLSTFNRQFKQQMNCSPREHRKIANA